MARERIGSRVHRVVGVLGLVLALLFLFSLLGVVIGPSAPFAISTALGASMFPTIRSGDMLFLVSARLSPVGPGDIALYRTETHFVVHRVLEVRGDTYVFKGDNNLVPEVVEASRVYFKVVLVVPPTTWVPVLATATALVGLAVFGLPQRAQRSREYLSSYGVLYFLLLSVSVSVLSVNSLDTPPVYQVKPNPLPQVSSLYRGDGVLVVRFDEELPPLRSLACTVSGTPVPCRASGASVLLVLGQVAGRDTAHPVHLHIVATPDTPYNLTIHYELTTVLRPSS